MARQRPWIVMFLIFTLLSAGLWSLLLSTTSAAIPATVISDHSLAIKKDAPCHKLQTDLHADHHATQVTQASQSNQVYPHVQQPFASNHCGDCGNWHCMQSPVCFMSAFDFPQQPLQYQNHQPHFVYARHVPIGVSFGILRPPKA